MLVSSESKTNIAGASKSVLSVLIRKLRDSAKEQGRKSYLCL